MFTELLDPKSQTYISKPDIIFIWPTYRDIQEYNVSVDIWSATNYKKLRADC